MNALYFAIQFLTRIPVPKRYTINEDTQRQSLYWHGVVGLIIGMILVTVASLVSMIFSNAPLLAAALVLLVWVAITGALHLDGLGDTADAWLGGYGDKKKTLAIMKDPTSGPAAIVWILLVLLIKFGAIVSFLNSNNLLPLLFVPLMARLASMCLFATTPYVRKAGIATPFVQNINKEFIYSQCVIAFVLGTLIYGLSGVLATVAVVFTVCYLRYLMIRRIQGTTGDTAGALIECSETAAMIGFLVSMGQ